ncbi:MAG TPA: ABC transporter permease [Thermoplasmata archaeon]|nr:ABC transporter permease [Thermoplasmata archaeon]
MNFSIYSSWEIAKKEFYEHLKTKRLIIIGGLYIAGFLLSVGILSHYSSHSPEDFPSIMGSAHSIVSIFYIILPITLSYDLIVRERSRKSIYLLLSKPVSREEIIFGKFVGVLLIICCVIIPIATAGHLITIAYCGFPSIDSIARAYAYIGIVILGSGCYISFSMLFSTITRTTATSIISSLIVGWFGLNMLYPITLIINFLSGGSSSTPWYSKIAYAISPSNNMGAAQRILTDRLMGIPTQNLYPISTSQSLISLVIFLLVSSIITTFLFHRRELN